MRRGRRSWLRLSGLLVLVVLSLSACAKNADLTTLQPKGKSARQIDNLIKPVFAAAGVVLLIIFVLTFIIIVRFRDRGDDEWPEQLHGNTKAELAWTIGPALVLAVVAVFTMRTLFQLNEHSSKHMDVVVVGQQWWWEYRYYPDGFDPAKNYDPQINQNITYNIEGKEARTPAIVTATQLVMPANTEVRIFTTSRDVIHSHWIPALNGKKDAVPGLFSPWKLEADDPGVYFGQCTEFCGLSHSRMRMQVVALSAADYQTWFDAESKPAVASKADGTADAVAQAWIDQQHAIAKGTTVAASAKLATPAATAEQRGMTTFRSVCSTCHLASGINDDVYPGKAAQVSGAAPNLTHFASRSTFIGGLFPLYTINAETKQPEFNRNELEAWLRNPPSIKDAKATQTPLGRGMPNLGLSEDQIDDLIAFLQTLGPKPSDATITKTEVE